jgi:hypothetical protein
MGIECAGRGLLGLIPIHVKELIQLLEARKGRHADLSVYIGSFEPWRR